MTRPVTFEGKTFNVPDDATDDEIFDFVGKSAPPPAPKPTFMQKVGKVISPKTGKVWPPQFFNPPADPEENKAWRKTGMDWFEDAFRLPMRTLSKLRGQNITDPELFLLRPKYEKKKAAYDVAEPAFVAKHGKLPVDLNTSDPFAVLSYLRKKKPNATVQEAIDFQKEIPQEPSKFMHETASDPTMYPIFKALGLSRMAVTGGKDLLVEALHGLTGVKGAALRKGSTGLGRRELEDAAATGGEAGFRLSEQVNTMNKDMPEALIVDKGLGEFGFGEKAPIISELEKHKYPVLPGTNLERFQQTHNDKIDEMISNFTGEVEKAPIDPSTIAPKAVKPVKVKPDPENMIDPNTGLIDRGKLNTRYVAEEKKYNKRLKAEMDKPRAVPVHSAGEYMRKKFGTPDGRGVRINPKDLGAWGLLDLNGMPTLTPGQMKNKMEGLYVNIDPRAPRLGSVKDDFNSSMNWGHIDDGSGSG